MKHTDESPLHKKMKLMKIGDVIDIQSHEERSESFRIARWESISIQTWTNRITGKGFKIKRTK